MRSDGPSVDGEVRTSKATVRVEGFFGASRAPDVVAELLAAFDMADEVELALDGLSGADVSLVQLLASARETADQRGARLRVVSHGYALRQCLERCGFTHLFDWELLSATEEVGYFLFGGDE